MDTELRRVRGPKMDFVTLAAAFGGHSGEVVNSPADVGPSVRRGVESVLHKRKSYILDMRVALDTPAPPPAGTPASPAARQAQLAQMLDRYLSQPPVDFFHGQPATSLRALAEPADPAPAINLPIIF